MQIYYFDMKDRVPVRDRVGLEFKTNSPAIEHSKNLARRAGHAKGQAKDKKLCIVVLNQSGKEVHREPVYPPTA